MSELKAVLVTGASTGIGRGIVERLSDDGYFVYAGARKRSDLEALGALRNVHPLPLDVTNWRDIVDALDTVTRSKRGLYALVNNAGITTYGAVIDTSDEEFELVIAVNVLGPYRMTRAFAPLIVSQRGRIIMISSISGILAMPKSSVYSMSKHAVEALTDSLGAEMEPVGVSVSAIEPGSYRTNLVTNSIARALEKTGVPPRSNSLSVCGEPHDVIAAILSALKDPQPCRRYLVVPEESQARITLEKQIAQLVQLNEASPFRYDRNALVSMLDEALLRSGDTLKR